MAILPSSDRRQFSDTHLVRRPQSRATAFTATSSLGRTKWWDSLNVKAAAVCAVLVIVFGWVLPRIYEPFYIRVDPLDSKRLTYSERQWFGPTRTFELEPRFDKDLRTWVWMRKDAFGEWQRFFALPRD